MDVNNGLKPLLRCKGSIKISAFTRSIKISAFTRSIKISGFTRSIKVCAIRKALHLKKELSHERGSLSVVIIALFFITVASLMVMSDVATVLVAKRSLAQATEAAAQRGVHTLDKASYYTGKGTMLTAPIALLTHRDHTPIPIDCNRAVIEVMLELHNWSNDDGSMKRQELQGIVLTDFNCDGTTVEISTYAEVKLPFTVPFSTMDSANLTSTVGTTNQVQEGFYLFGVRLH